MTFSQSAVSLVFNLATLIPSIAVSVRRLHDTNRSGWWNLIALTFVGIIPLLIWLCQAGDKNDNQYGGDPLAKAADAFA